VEELLLLLPFRLELMIKLVLLLLLLSGVLLDQVPVERGLLVEHVPELLRLRLTLIGLRNDRLQPDVGVDLALGQLIDLALQHPDLLVVLLPLALQRLLQLGSVLLGVLGLQFSQLLFEEVGVLEGQALLLALDAQVFALFS